MWSLILAILSFTQLTFAAQTLITVEPETTVYTGPGTYYRPLLILPARTEIRASDQPKRGRDQTFYRVLVEMPDGKKSTGYILSTENLIKKSDSTPLNLDEYSELSLAKDLISISAALMKSNNKLFLVGYQKFMAPGFYVKGFMGQWRQESNEAFVAGVEIGNDALIYKRLSYFISLGTGVLSPNSQGAIFTGSTKYNALIDGTTGFRYNMSGAAIGLGYLQAAAFNPNNSLLSGGLLATLEVAL